MAIRMTNDIDDFHMSIDAAEFLLIFIQTYSSILFNNYASLIEIQLK